MLRFRRLATHAFAPLAMATLAIVSCSPSVPEEAPPPTTGKTAVPAPTAGGVEVPLAFQQAGVTALDLSGPHRPEADKFHPDKRQVTAALGGRVITHLPSEPPNLNKSIENAAVISYVHYDIHHSLLEFNPSTWKNEPVLARSFDTEDTVVLKGGRTKDNGNIVFGTVTEEADAYVVRSGSSANPLAETRIAKADVESVERGTVFTFHLRDDVLWHDGEKFDATDVLFSFEVFKNPHVDADERRFAFEDVVKGEILDPYRVRFFYDHQYFQAEAAFGDSSLNLLPSHLYNLLDPTNKKHNPKATAEQQGTFVNENPHNITFVGLGPYKLVAWERGRYLEATRFDGYFDKRPEKAGYVDTIRWALVDDDNLAFQALLNGELDIFDRVKSEDFFGQATQQPAFVDKFYKAYTYLGSLGYTCWNMYRPQLSDVRVRTALAHAFDVKDWIKTNYKGLTLPATAASFRFGPAYDQSVDVIEYDLEKAQALLTEAGWYDRDGDGIIDKDGVAFTIELLMPSGNKASEVVLQKMQESFEKLSIKTTIQPYEWATFLEKLLNRDFDAANLAWNLVDPESDPYQIWHSSQGERDKRSSNHAGLIDPEVDALIIAGRKELDPEKRYVIWKQLHRKVFEQQPYLFGWTVPRKFAFSKRLHGVRLYKFGVGYRLKDMYFEEGSPGTRPLSAGI